MTRRRLVLTAIVVMAAAIVALGISFDLRDAKPVADPGAPPARLSR